MNELAEPLIFVSITINFGPASAASRIEHQLSTLASGNSPATRWTKRLTIRILVPVKLTASAIQALSNVEFASFDHEEGPDAEVLEALSQLPKLRDLSLSLRASFKSTKRVLPLEAFANLRVVKLTSLPISASTINSIGRMVARCPALEELFLENGFNKTHIPNLDTIFNGSMRSPSFVPSLTKLTVRNSSLTISASSVPYLRSLVHLDVQVNAANIDASFWQTLALNGVQIRYFAVYPLDVAAIRYLASYEGLKEFHIQRHFDPDGIDYPDEVFHTVLSRHRHSLQKLSFPYLNFESWSITDEYLECVLKCTALQSLVLSYQYPTAEERLLYGPQRKLSMDMVSGFYSSTLLSTPTSDGFAYSLPCSPE
ncbi:hypothetical protein EST38_g8753 [Candolleomyces aberdarensis]|uniref:F-box/LRR-repeat protein 15/At3g58940/PEG3-like LRR domain-containing protein n=1 Tax=Candolleomyces aberdarensis TaxID=2316362 RepID=A0A4Q2DCH1_9AGAR|nr:hypothetical protein EST38_g8753 [Candolleomyces aberdarensis]